MSVVSFLANRTSVQIRVSSLGIGAQINDGTTSTSSTWSSTQINNSINTAVANRVRYDASQVLTDIQKELARDNIDSQGFITLTVGVAGSGADYIVDGTADEVEINAALTFISTTYKSGKVKLISPEYFISSSIIQPLYVELEGGFFNYFNNTTSGLNEVSTIHCRGANIDMIVQETQYPYRISNILLDGNSKQANRGISCGAFEYTIKNLSYQNVQIQNCKKGWGASDAWLSSSATPQPYVFDDSVWDNFRVRLCDVGIESYCSQMTLNQFLFGGNGIAVDVKPFSAVTFVGGTWSKNDYDYLVSHRNSISNFNEYGTWHEGAEESVLVRDSFLTCVTASITGTIEVGSTLTQGYANGTVIDVETEGLNTIIQIRRSNDLYFFTTGAVTFSNGATATIGSLTINNIGGWNFNGVKFNNQVGYTFDLSSITGTITAGLTFTQPTGSSPNTSATVVAVYGNTIRYKINLSSNSGDPAQFGSQQLVFSNGATAIPSNRQECTFMHLDNLGGVFNFDSPQFYTSPLNTTRKISTASLTRVNLKGMRSDTLPDIVGSGSCDIVTSRVLDISAGRTLLSGEAGGVIAIRGGAAAGLQTYRLPQILRGLKYTFVCLEAGSNIEIFRNATGGNVVDGKIGVKNSNAQLYDSITIQAVSSSSWTVTYHKGGWLYEDNTGVNRLSVPTYANNAAALSGGLAVNDIYKVATGELRIVV